MNNRNQIFYKNVINMDKKNKMETIIKKKENKREHYNSKNNFV